MTRSGGDSREGEKDTLGLKVVDVKAKNFFRKDEEIRGYRVSLSDTASGAEETLGNTVKEH